VCDRSALSYLVGPHGGGCPSWRRTSGPGHKRLVTPIATPIPTLLNNILLSKHFFVDIPSWNITGFATVEPSVVGKRLELLSEIVPGLKRAAIMFNPDATPASVYMPAFEAAARSLRVVSILAPVHSDAEIETAMIALGREPGGGLLILADVFTTAHRAPIISAAARNNVPVVSGPTLPDFIRDGGLLSYGPDLTDNFRRAASYVDRILRGEKPGDLPVQFPAKYEMVLNLKSAKALGLTVPQSILLRADEVIE